MCPGLTAVGIPFIALGLYQILMFVPGKPLCTGTIFLSVLPVSFSIVHIVIIQT
jgi:hypothetical protein